MFPKDAACLISLGVRLFWDGYVYGGVSHHVDRVNLQNINHRVNFNYDGDEFLVETDKNKMIEKICELQKKVAILNEEVDHLENHIDYLNFNLKKKTK